MITTPSMTGKQSKPASAMLIENDSQQYDVEIYQNENSSLILNVMFLREYITLTVGDVSNRVHSK
jgi:hypothetical protein